MQHVCEHKASLEAFDQQAAPDHIIRHFICLKLEPWVGGGASTCKSCLKGAAARAKMENVCKKSSRKLEHKEKHESLIK